MIRELQGKIKQFNSVINGAKIRASKPRRLGFSASVQIFPLVFEVVSIRPVGMEVLKAAG